MDRVIITIDLRGTALVPLYNKEKEEVLRITVAQFLATEVASHVTQILNKHLVSSDLIKISTNLEVNKPE